MVKHIKNIKCKGCNTKGKSMQLFSFSGKDKKHLTGTIKGRGRILGCCNCGLCIG